jgi:Cu(I)/Ag(I) efflux system membrane protein CusA/SilA
MQPLEEGAILYIATTMPGISVAKAKRVLQVSDWVLKQFPEVESIFSKARRAENLN